MAASGRYARGSVVSILIMINLSSHTVSTPAVVLTSWDRALSNSEGGPPSFQGWDLQVCTPVSNREARHQRLSTIVGKLSCVCGEKS